MMETSELLSVKLNDENGDHIGQACIYENEGNFVLYWNDGLVNEWSETFASFHLALARLSVLHYAVSVGEFFKNDPHEFALETGDFLKSQILEMK
jgi:hypothetical protein